MVAFTHLLGKNGLIALIGIATFFHTYAHSIKLFQWIEHQTLGTREYILQQLARLFIKVEPEKVTYLLLFLSFGLSCSVLIAFLLIGFWQMGVVAAIIVGVGGWKLPKPLVDYFVEKRIKCYQSQMVDALNLLGNGLKAGLSFNQGLQMVVDEMSPPVSQEFKRVLNENSLGQPMEECLEGLAKRIPLAENDMFVTSVNILKEAGGNLADIFETITNIIRERIHLQQKIDTYTAQAKVQSTIISCMPMGMLTVYTLMDPKKIMQAFTHPIGLALIVGAIILNIVGYFVIRKIIIIKA